MAAKDSFDAFLSIIKDKVDEFSESTDQSNIQIFKNEIKDKLDDLAKSQGYVSKEEFDALKILSTRLEERIKKLEELLRK
tara:strand:+ start:936 stop:1175 length:240 start_codon:yes stop_codon:yes gene_type:complete